MIDYQNIKKHCQQNTILTQTVIDDFLIYYAAKQDKLTIEAEQKLAKYKHITDQQDPSWVWYLKTQFIAHRIFKKEGLIAKYLNHNAIKNLSQEESYFLKRHAATPWRFCFSTIINNPADNFYEMEDIFSEESFLLYSTGTTDILKGGKPLLWFNLIGFNGYCWQSFGPISGYSSFQLDDIYFYATELAPHLEYETDIMDQIDSNPVPYMMLLSGSEYPLTFHKNDQIVLNQAEYDAEAYAIRNPGKYFEMDSTENVHRYRLVGWDEFPHYVQVYHDENTRNLLLTSMTDKGFLKLVRTLNSEGLNIPEYPELRLNLTMLATAKKILKRDIPLNPYEDLFEEKSSPAEQKELDDLNNLVGLMLPDINAGKLPDFQALSKKTELTLK